MDYGALGFASLGRLPAAELEEEPESLLSGFDGDCLLGAGAGVLDFSAVAASLQQLMSAVQVFPFSPQSHARAEKVAKPSMEAKIIQMDLRVIVRTGVLYAN